tara:strand:- start:856 stop:1596 length:741 start_codon:yes stop_codon:yes gene_type:complete
MAYSSDTFANKYEAALYNIANLYQRTVDSNAGTNELLSAIGNIDFKDLFENELGFNKELDNVALSYLDALRNMDGFADVDETVLRALVESDLNIYRSKFNDTYVHMKSLFTESVINGLPREIFIEQLSKGQFGVLSKSQAKALYTDSLAKFNRSVIKQMAKNAPANLLYIFTGPIDNRTSDGCLQVLAAGPMTLGQINNQFPGVFENGTHFNCRHQFRRYTSKGMYKQNKLDRAFDERDLTQKQSL